MQTTSLAYKEEINRSGRHFAVKAIIDGIEYYGIKGLKIKGGTNSSSEITFGDTVSSFVEFILTDVNDLVMKGKKVLLYIGLLMSDGTIEWIKKGVYHMEKPVKTGGYLKITAYDNFSLCEKGFFSDLKGKQKIASILQEQCRRLGILYSGGADDVTYDIDLLSGMTIREAIGVLSAYCGKNAVMDASGNLKLVWYTQSELIIEPFQYTEPLEMDEEDTFINRLECMCDENQKLTSGLGIGIRFSCPGMTQNRLDELFNRIQGFTYRSVKLNWKIARPDIEAGDLIQIKDTGTNYYMVPLMEYEFSCDGGYFGTVTSKGKTKEQQENEYKGPMQSKIQHIYDEVLTVKTLTVDTITAFEGKFETINTNYLEVNKKITANEGAFNTLNGDYASFKVSVHEDLTALHATIDNLDADSITAALAKITILETDMATIGTIINRVTTSDSIHSLLINADTAVIDNAYFKSIISENITVSDLKAGNINTTRFGISSESGNLSIFDNTVQIKDGERVRIQIGKDAANDYSLTLWDIQGNTIWDARGLKAEGIKDAIIRNDMISNSANIDGKKINISSVVTQINAGTNKIESSHVLYDGKSLNVAFDTMITDTNGKLSTLTTALSTEQGRISTLISEATQIKDDVGSLQTDYSALNQTLNTLSITVGSHSSSIADLDNDLKGLHIGGRNLLRNANSVFLSSSDHPDNTKREVGKVTSLINGGRGNFYCFAESLLSDSVQNLTQQIGDQYVGSVEIRSKGMDSNSYVDLTFDFRDGATSGRTESQPKIKIYMDDCEGKWYKIKDLVITVKGSHSKFLICGGLNNFPKGAILEYRNFKFEKGTRSSDFSVAPEDIENSIREIADKQVIFQASLDGITSRVSKTETSISTINGSVSSLSTRVSTAESKITDNAIVSTVTKSSTWSALNSIVNKNADLLEVKDTRSTNSNPQWYFENYPLNTLKEFKTCTIIGLSGEGRYCELITEVPWKENSGGYPTQLAYPNNSQNIYRRVGTSLTTWGPWSKVAGTHNIVSSINQTAESIKIQAARISLEGIVTANSRFKILSDGSMEAVNGKFAGEINALSGKIGNWAINQTTGAITSKSNNNTSGMLVIQNTQSTPVEGGSVAGVTLDATSFKMITATADSGIDIHAYKTSSMGSGDMVVKVYQNASYAMVMSSEINGGTGFKTNGFMSADGEIRGGSLKISGAAVMSSISVNALTASGRIASNTLNVTDAVTANRVYQNGNQCISFNKDTQGLRTSGTCLQRGSVVLNMNGNNRVQWLKGVANNAVASIAGSNGDWDAMSEPLDIRIQGTNVYIFTTNAKGVGAFRFNFLIGYG